MQGLTGKRVVITGGFSAIAAGIVQRLVAEGSQVLVTDIKGQAEGDAYVASLGQGVKYAVCNIAESADCDAAIQTAVDALGGVDVAIAHAGISDNAPFWELTDAMWEKVVQVNLTGSFYFARAAMNAMLNNERGVNGRRGTIIFTSTWVAQRPWPDCANYCASKAGVDGLIRCIAQEAAGHGITANGVAPGFVAAGETQKHYDNSAGFKQQVDDTVPLGRMSPPEELASLYAYLASDEAAYMTGVTLPFDGGASVVKRDTWKG